MKKILLPALLLLLSVPFFSCSKINDMHDATMQMGDDLGTMKETTSTVSTDTKSLGKVMCELYDSGRQGTALDQRNKQWQSILNAKTMEDKGVYATAYFEAFEFQLWSNLCDDKTTITRDRLMEDAVNEFFGHVLAVNHWNPDEVDPFAGDNPLAYLNPFNKEDEKAAFNALAGKLESRNRLQNSVDQDPNSEELTMLSILEEGLLATQAIRAGVASPSDYPEYINIVGQREELSIRLLKARYQAMGLAVAGFLNPTLLRSPVDGAWVLLLGNNWEMDMSKLNDAQVKLVNYRLGEALRAKDFLERIGVSVTLHKDVKKLFDNAKVLNAPRGGGENGAEPLPENSLQMKQVQMLEQLAEYAGEPTLHSRSRLKPGEKLPVRRSKWTGAAL